jgi:hypothetical protein
MTDPFYDNIAADIARYKRSVLMIGGGEDGTAVRLHRRQSGSVCPALVLSWTDA